MKKTKNIFLSASGLINQMDPDIPLVRAYKIYRAAYHINKELFAKVNRLEKKVATLEDEVDRLTDEKFEFESDCEKYLSSLEDIRGMIDQVLP
jgi:hypothetical protein